MVRPASDVSRCSGRLPRTHRPRGSRQSGELTECACDWPRRAVHLRGPYRPVGHGPARSGDARRVRDPVRRDARLGVVLRRRRLGCPRYYWTTGAPGSGHSLRRRARAGGGLRRDRGSRVRLPDGTAVTGCSPDSPAAPGRQRLARFCPGRDPAPRVQPCGAQVAPDPGASGAGPRPGQRPARRPGRRSASPSEAWPNALATTGLCAPGPAPRPQVSASRPASRGRPAPRSSPPRSAPGAPPARSSRRRGGPTPSAGP